MEIKIGNKIHNNKLEDLEIKAITLVKQEANRAIERVRDIKIVGNHSFELAESLLNKISYGQKALKELRESITKPAEESLRNLRALFIPIENNLKEANAELKGKMKGYNDRVKIEADIKKALITEKVESGEISFEKASKQIEKVEQKVEAMPTRKMRVIEIVDEAKIPLKYWELNMVLLRKDALAGIKIEGVEVIEREIIVSKN